MHILQNLCLCVDFIIMCMSAIFGKCVCVCGGGEEAELVCVCVGICVYMCQLYIFPASLLWAWK